MTQRADADLVAAALAGDKMAVGAIYDRYSDRVYSFCVSRLRNSEQAADATHETFVRAATRLSTLRDPRRLRSWLFAIARNQIVDQARDRERTTSLEAAGEMAADLPGHEADLLAAESAQLLWEAADSLQERDLNLLELQLRQGLEGPDLADALGVTTSHLHVLQSRMKDRIEKALGSLLIARHGRDDCGELQGLLSDWDGRFTLSVRSKVTRHVEGCAVCQDTKAAVLLPGRFLGVLPLMAVPVLLRTRTAAAMEAAIDTAALPQTGRGDDWTWRNDGFPNAAGTARKAAAWWWVAAAATIIAVIAIAGGVALLLGDNDSPSVVLVAAGDDEEIDSPTPSPEPTPTVETSESAPAPDDEPVGGDNGDGGESGSQSDDEDDPVIGFPIPTPTATPVPPTPVPPTPVPPTPVPPTPVPPTPVPPTPVPPTPVPVPGSIVVGASTLDLGYGTSGSVALSNPGELPADWSASITGPFTVTPSGQAPGLGGSEVFVTVDPQAADGTHAGNLTISSVSGDEVVVVTAIIDSIAPSVGTPKGASDCFVEVTASDQVAIASVVLDWSIPDGPSGSVTLVGSSTLFQGVVGPTPAGEVRLTIIAVATATDLAGNTTTSSPGQFTATCP